MVTITAELHKLIDEQKKKLCILEQRIDEKNKAIAAAYANQEQEAKATKEEDDNKRARRRANSEKSFKGCTEEEIEEDLLAIFNGVKSDKHVVIQSDGRAAAVIKRQKITEGDVIRVVKGESYEIGIVKSLNRNVLILENREREKKYPISKLLSSRYAILPVEPK
ncbi:hypothetical protein NEDG_02150 [Nematocida displodere]|uniref:Uncharacterized protein n=1 Tax=Nematocida displodere TaxID=1805483 RepID=A0A177EGC0_9MICR|nr:hypothetical protein NEDG_02150 [Nematocida displodere]